MNETQPVETTTTSSSNKTTVVDNAAVPSEEKKENDNAVFIHPNIALVSKNPPGVITPDVYAPNAVFHMFNHHVPEFNGDYVGIEAIRGLFETIGRVTRGSFHVQPVDIQAFGDELVVVHTINSMRLLLPQAARPNDDDDDDEETTNEKKDAPETVVAVHVALVWRVVDGKVTEIWDIPSQYTTAGGTGTNTATRTAKDDDVQQEQQEAA
mmetsp:Transcript_122161/g.182486  ORF Transcript_122161/g.182486 Transcript_122161/m.182486 type:complete len:210 (-) Transcript_122161:139-768(-)